MSDKLTPEHRTAALEELEGWSEIDGRDAMTKGLSERDVILARKIERFAS